MIEQKYKSKASIKVGSDSDLFLQLFQLNEFDKFYKDVLPKTKNLKYRGICFYPEISDTKLVFNNMEKQQDNKQDNNQHNINHHNNIYNNQYNNQYNKDIQRTNNIHKSEPINIKNNKNHECFIWCIAPSPER